MRRGTSPRIFRADSPPTAACGSGSTRRKGRGRLSAARRCAEDGAPLRSSESARGHVRGSPGGSGDPLDVLPGELSAGTASTFRSSIAMENAGMSYGLGAVWAGAGRRVLVEGSVRCPSLVSESSRTGTREIYNWVGPDGSRILMKWNSLHNENVQREHGRLCRGAHVWQIGAGPGDDQRGDQRVRGALSIQLRSASSARAGTIFSTKNLLI